MILQLLAKFLALPPVASWLINRAMKTPYFHLPGYMERYWLLNPYDPESRKAAFSWFPFHIRIHHILREDRGAHHHDHPWNARTFILRGAYIERRGDELFSRIPGNTVAIKFGEYHHIEWVSKYAKGTWTLFIVGKFRGDWGFLVDGTKVPHGEYIDNNRIDGYTRSPTA